MVQEATAAEVEVEFTSTNRQKMIAQVISTLKQSPLSKNDLARYKVKLCYEFKEKEIPTDIEILLHADQADIPQLKKLLLTKPVRTISGVSPVAIMTRPFRCPHGRCTMCPGGLGSPYGDVPQSYTGHEPATIRGIRADYDSYFQMYNRLEQYVVGGHIPDKADLIIMGGTFPATPKSYQEEFVTYALKAMNDFSDSFFVNSHFNMPAFKEFFELPGTIGDPRRAANIRRKMAFLKGASTLEAEQSRNEISSIRCIGITIETKPDWGLLTDGNQMLRLGATRIELGVQSVYEEPLRTINRGHGVKENVEAIRVLKDLGFKLNFHMMLGLPGIEREQDIAGMKQLFDDPAYRPDMLKIYPCMVMPGTPLYEDFKRGIFTPISTSEAADRIAEIKKFVPPYCRIMRVQRDIPTKMTIAGVDKTNLRQVVAKMCNEREIACRCIRCREAGRARKVGHAEIVVQSFEASGGTEFFISAEDKKNDVLLGFCRMRFPSQQLRDEITKDSAIVRELHVYGSAVQIGAKGDVQHKGWGKKLMQRAEELARAHNKKKMLVISGIGVREYFYNLGYLRDGPYVSKML
ncbi:tRNA uridine(34) 5-carboxymethylaminomethyl modification radical SAM/GNAT enzyme Elp3 [Candidatus Woesearchaeota archaeon]|nr:tRNA uridine(34) 5-carboxymethylaminomethyl modification radical SAM/GNAT enzyme Elp3 [Candidatus Woesearchaeota archaeon]